MEVTIENTIKEIYSSEQCDLIGIQEYFDIYSKDENGKKIIDVNKVKAEFEKIKSSTNESLKKDNASKLVKDLVIWLGTYEIGVAILSTLASATIIGVLELICLISMYIISKNHPDSKYKSYKILRHDIAKAIHTTEKMYNNAYKKDKDKATKLKKELDNLEKVQDKLDEKIQDQEEDMSDYDDNDYI